MHKAAFSYALFSFKLPIKPAAAWLLVESARKLVDATLPRTHLNQTANRRCSSCGEKHLRCYLGQLSVDAIYLKDWRISSYEL